LEAALRAEQAALVEYFTSSPDPKVGIRAFIAKQTPVFED
jgi:hypothetical protein